MAHRENDVVALLAAARDRWTAIGGSPEQVRGALRAFACGLVDGVEEPSLCSRRISYPSDLLNTIYRYGLQRGQAAAAGKETS